ncbi:MAG: hypothetical protein ACI9WU_003794 [Myxococcota bacterium]|jgi:hypothetical protein
MIALGVAILLLAAGPAERGLEIARAADTADTGFGMEQTTATMTIQRSGGRTETRVFRLTTTDGSQGSERSLVELLKPARHKGMRVLTVTASDGGEAVFLRLPHHRRTRRIVGRKRTGRFLGSELTFEDLGSRRHDRYTHRWLRDEPVRGAECHVVETTPRDPDTGYSRIVLWRDVRTYQLMRVAWFGPDGVAVKTGDFTDWQKTTRFHRANRYTIVNATTGQTTTVVFSGRTHDVSLDSSALTRQGLER